MCVHVSWKKRDHAKERKKDVILVVKIKYIFNKWQWVIKKNISLRVMLDFLKIKYYKLRKLKMKVINDMDLFITTNDMDLFIAITLFFSSTMHTVMLYLI